ncbi:DUF559 domain-containing protein [Burkholderia vietnamiensis]|uniref:integrase repeat-containing protein n=1 Tax=Burkholderia vietnamiensis TaxID=60552 RepID=UPI001B92FFAD|nr:integrase repeat-containing protein [Burkholderia vietnamiensis]MBR8082611.1 DUF559 domain-containing protein [Burkholderia vietnamiensis]
MRSTLPDFPSDLPVAPDAAYKTEWKGWGAFLGTGRVATQNRRYRSYEEARAWARGEGIETSADWLVRIQKPMPDDIPRTPEVVYRSEWKANGGWGGFLGGRARRSSWPSYEDLSTWAVANAIKTERDWTARYRRGEMPVGFPSNLRRIFPDFHARGGWPAFLQRGRLSGTSVVEMALKMVFNNVFESDADHRLSIDVKDGGRKINVDMVDRRRRIVVEYDGSHWHRKTAERDRRQTLRLMGDGWHVIRVREAPLALLDPIWDVSVQQPNGEYWPMIKTVLGHVASLITRKLIDDHTLLDKIHQVLGAPTSEADFASIRPPRWWTYEQVAAWARAQGIRSATEWRLLARLDSWPSGVPTSPHLVYKDFYERGGMSGLLGVPSVNGRRGAIPRRSFESTSAWAQGRGIKTMAQWSVLSKSMDDWPRDIPKDPYRAFPDLVARGGIQALLGTGRFAKRYVINLQKSTDPENDASFVQTMSA